MRRFERLMHKPVVVREIEVDGANVITREGSGELVTTTFEGADAAKQHADALITQWRADGFVPITRLPPVVEPETVRRDVRGEWNTAKWGRKFREVFQSDAKTRVIDGSIVGGHDTDKDTDIKEWTTVREASAVYEQLVAAMHREAAEAEQEHAQQRERTAEKQAAKREAKRQQRLEQNRNLGLEAQCRAAPDDPQPWGVYADWLIEQDDSIGEAAALGARGEIDAAKSLLRRSAYELHSEHEHEHITFELRYGFVRSLTLKIGYDSAKQALPELVKRVLSSPACRFVDSLRFGLGRHQGYENDWGPTLAMVCEMPQAPTMRELRFDAYNSRDCEISWVAYGDFAFAWPKLPMLELLHIRAGLSGNLGTLDVPNLRAYIRESGGLRRGDVAPLYTQPRPNLEHLELWTGTDRYDGEIAMHDIQPILDADGFPKLRHLGIVNSELSDTIIPALAKSRILPQLHSLDLSKGIFANIATDALIANAAAFRHLASIDLSSNVLYAEEVAAIRAVLDNVIVNNQRDDDREDDFPDDPGERFVALGE